MFNGFYKETIKFYKELESNNSKEWFNAHRADYDNFVMNPAREFVVALGGKLELVTPEINAIPKTDKSIFRIHRDIRFSPDKRPYKTHLGVFLWEGSRKKLECPGLYLQIDKDKILIGEGIYMFPKNVMKIFREKLTEDKSGNEFNKIVSKLKKLKYEIGGKHYKRIPGGFDKDHKNAEYLLHNGLWVGKTYPIIKEFYSEEFLDWCFEHYMEMLDLHNWMLGII
jgi:uncharacterized protein (TIGR02453 family)